MTKTLAIALIGIAAVASATPGMARPHHNRWREGYGQYYSQPDYPAYGQSYGQPVYRSYGQYYGRPVYRASGCGSLTDRNCDGFDDRDTNFNGRIDPWEAGGAGRYSRTDRNGDGFDDRDTNFNGVIDPWEAGGGYPR